MAKRITPEGSTLKAVVDLLAAKRILAFRQNSGAFQGEHNGRKRFVKFGVPGMADIEAFIKPLVMCSEFNFYGKVVWVERRSDRPQPLWIEVKSPAGRQSPEQQSFQRQVESDGHSYLLVRDVDDLIQWLKERGL